MPKIESNYKNPQNRNNKIEKILYIEKDKMLFVNESLHFTNVAKDVWEYKIGGYIVLDKYLKSHKNEELDYEYFKKIINALSQTLELESKITAISLES